MSVHMYEAGDTSTSILDTCTTSEKKNGVLVHIIYKVLS